MTEQPPIIEHDRIEPVDINLEMQRSYIDYAMTVIVSRALPDVRDGMKPVHRRVVYAMYDGGYRPDRGYNKCSRVVGEVMGQYLSLIHISEPTRLGMTSYAVLCLKKNTRQGM